MSFDDDDKVKSSPGQVIQTITPYPIQFLARVIQKVDKAIHRINHYPADSVVCFVTIYPLDSDLCGA